MPHFDPLKSYAEIYSPDDRWRSLVRFDPAIGNFRPSTLAERHAEVAAICLNESVPTDIREHFETAKNLLLYAWFVYRFVPVAELHARASTEMALRERARIAGLLPKRPNLGNLMSLAVAQQWLIDEGFSVYRQRRELVEADREMYRQMGSHQTDPVDEDAQSFVKILVKSMPALRNDLAHGSRSVYPSSFGTLNLCADLINQLFPPR